jgi:hypothetical protein
MAFMLDEMNGGILGRSESTSPHLKNVFRHRVEKSLQDSALRLLDPMTS